MSGHLKRLKRLHEYGDTVARLFPTLPLHYIDLWSTTKPDALVLGYFLESYPGKVIILEIGTFVGVSAFFFASHPKVVRVISIDPNPKIADEINDKLGMLDISIDPGPLGNLRVLDLAQTALKEFPDEQQKIQLHVGVVGSHQVGVQGGFLHDLERVEVPVLEPSDEVSLVAYVDGLKTPEGVQADLEAIFERNPSAVAIVRDCRYAWGPFVQGGIAKFMEASGRKYHFFLFEHLGPGLGLPNLGIVYPDINAAEVERILLDFKYRLRFLKRIIQLEVREPLQFIKIVFAFGLPTILRKTRSHLF